MYEEMTDSELLDRFRQIDDEVRRKSWSLFSSYNRHDVGLLVKLEAKLKLISLAFSVSYMIKMNFSDCFGTIKPWDTFIQNYLSRRNEFVPATFDIRPPDRQIAGGFVKDPIAGKYKWVVSFDATSLYPSIIRTFNISPETILDSHEIPSDLLPYYNKEHHESLLANPDSELAEILKKHNLAMTLNGQFFRRDKQGLIPELTAYVFDERVKAKNEMKAWKKKLQTAPENEHPKIEAMIDSLNNKQLALKVTGNGLYGALANQYFRFFDFRCAEGITLTGQYFINRCGTEGSAYIDGLSGVENSSQYQDTDSVAPDSIIYYNGERITIEEAFNRGGTIVENSGRNFVIQPEATTMAYDGGLVERKINYIMKHRVKKRMFRISVNGTSVVCTEDHSIMVMRDETLQEVKPNEIRGGDKIIRIKR